MSGAVRAVPGTVVRGPLDQLTSLRFAAACVVLLSHLTFLETRSGSISARLFAGLFSQGFSGVTFFYVLSGFILSYAYRSALLSGEIDRRDFLLRRIARILPLHWLTAAAVALYLVAIRHEPPTGVRAALNALLLHAWAPEPDIHYSLNGPSWSLSCELFFYVMFPLLVVLPVQRLALLAGVMIGFLGACAVYASHVTSGFSPALEWFFYVVPATRLLDFVVGMLVFHLWQAGHLARVAGTSAEVCILVLLPLLAWGMARADVPLPWRWQLAYLLPVAAAVLLFAHGRGMISRALRNRWLVLMGEASFALYLTHRPIILLGGRVLQWLYWVPPLLIAAGMAAFCVLVSLVVYRWLDMPVQRWLRRRLDRGGRAAVGSFPSPHRVAVAPALLVSSAAMTLWLHHQAVPAAALPLQVPPTTIGINLSGLAPYNRQLVFANMIAQSQWFGDAGHGWTLLPPAQLDARGWVRYLDPGQVAPRPLTLPPAPIGTVDVRCTWKGKGSVSAGGLARYVEDAPGRLDLRLVSAGAEDESAWIQLDSTDRDDPVRDIDCRDRRLPADAVFHPEFIAFLRGFTGIRFLDWQRTNENLPVRWSSRTTPASSSQVDNDGAAIEEMVALANQVGADPWFLMPYNAGPEYVEGFARLVHARLDPARTVYVEFGNEQWNDMFAATLQARREGLALGLDSEPVRAQTRRYAQRSRAVMQTWTRVFADRPDRLVRVLGGLNVYPDLFRDALDYEDTARWIDALATAPYIQLDLTGRGAGQENWVFAQLEQSVREALSHAAQNKALAARYGKRYIAYEGGQHLVTKDIPFGRSIQRDPRMMRIYAEYLRGWQAQIGDRLTLYASTSPVGEWGAWGLREYAGQPDSQTPKLRAVRTFMGGAL